MKHRILFTHDKGFGGRELQTAVKKAVLTALDAEQVDIPCEVSVYFTGDEEIHRLNREFREVDRPTDVLSFPMQELTPGDFDPDEEEIDPESGRLPLGDVILSCETASRQAEELGHSAIREMAYLSVHSILHLLGYDHVDEAEMKKQMRGREKVIMQILYPDEEVL